MRLYFPFGGNDKNSALVGFANGLWLILSMGFASVATLAPPHIGVIWVIGFFVGISLNKDDEKKTSDNEDLENKQFVHQKTSELLSLKDFEMKQYKKINCLKNDLLDAIAGDVEKDKKLDLDVWNDAQDRHFALKLLSVEENPLNELEEAIKRLENGSYGICELSGEKIPEGRLEAIPFTRYTTQSKSQIELEKEN